MIFQLMKCEIGANTNKFVLIFVALNVKASCGSEVWFLVIFWVAFLQQHSIISGLVGRLGVIRERTDECPRSPVAPEESLRHRIEIFGIPSTQDP